MIRVLHGAEMAIHWSVGLLIAGTLIRGGAWGWALLAAALVWAMILGIKGFNRPGPKLTGAARMAHRAGHPVLMALLLAGAAATAWEHPLGRPLLLATLAVASLHGLFHLWRHMSLGDGALRAMLPRALHGLL